MKCKLGKLKHQMITQRKMEVTTYKRRRTQYGAEHTINEILTKQSKRGDEESNTEKGRGL